MKFYIDTSVWLDYFQDRGDGIRPIGLFAFMFLKKCQKEGLKIIVSDIVVKEMEKLMTKE